MDCFDKIEGQFTSLDTVGCNDLPVFRRPVRRNPEMIYNRPYEECNDNLFHISDTESLEVRIYYP